VHFTVAWVTEENPACKRSQTSDPQSFFVWKSVMYPA